MFEWTKAELMMAQASLASTIRKNKKVLTTLNTKENPRQSQITMVRHNLTYFQLAEALINAVINDSPTPTYSEAELIETLQALPKFQASVEKILPKFKEGTSQHTLAIRRIRSFEIASALIKKELEA